MRYLSAAGPFLRRRLKPPNIPDPTPVHTASFADRKSCYIDVYTPNVAGPHPSALIVHGGGFVGGSRRMSSVRVVIEHLLQQGFVVASLDYRLVRPWGPFLDGQVLDVRDGARWWHENAPGFGADPTRSVIIGLSAGGGLGVMAADAAPFSRFIGVYGAYDLTLLPARWATATSLIRSRHRRDHSSQSPLMMGHFEQPALLIHGDIDPLAVPEHSRRLADARAARGLPTELCWIEGAVHGYLQDGASHPHSAQTLSLIDSFLSPLSELVQPSP
ncbi:MAG: alpha/beta hydrolase [Myxococcota bacterium]